MSHDDRHIACYPDPHEIGAWVVSLADDDGEIEALASRHGDDAEDRAWSRAQRYADSLGLPVRLWSDRGWL
jgi:hypothetical protein